MKQDTPFERKNEIKRDNFVRTATFYFRIVVKTCKIVKQENEEILYLICKVSSSKMALNLP